MKENVTWGSSTKKPDTLETGFNPLPENIDNKSPPEIDTERLYLCIKHTLFCLELQEYRGLENSSAR